ncbi:MAG: hypothetical protein DRJ37_04160 [Thermoprotei archaeon]|nr:MAG: hypothetical protein DRJ37_04160 [Thermoprotei archaeon]
MKVSPLHYDIYLRIDPRVEDFEGHVKILVEAKEEIDEIVLNSLELDIKECKAVKNGRIISCRFEVKEDELKVKLGERLSGSFILEIGFTGKLSDKMVGLYRSKWEKGYIAVTQLEETHARRAFPCFDHPRFRATFEVTLEVPEFFEAISNMNPVEISFSNGWKKVRFAKTPKMPTYLLFFGVGSFRIYPSEDSRVRVAALPCREKYMDFALGNAYKYVRFFEEYLKYPYMLPKLDLITVPDFIYGAMENWGAITFRENLLLYYPGKTSKSALKRIGEVIAHEIIHHWFGNLVSPKGWRYIWLNESFATLLSYKALADVHPEWNVDEMFVLNETLGALDRDSLVETHPIELEVSEEAKEIITASTAPIIYNKGACILAMFEDYVGSDIFARGLNKYLKKFEYGNASSDDFWSIMREVSGLDVEKFVDCWIRRKGYPVVVVEEKSGKILLKQKRFTYTGLGDSTRWVIPLKIGIFKNGEWKVHRIVLESESVGINVRGPVLVNFRRGSFVRVKYSSFMLDGLAELIREGKISSVDRWGLQDDFFALTLAGDFNVRNYLDFVKENYRGEDSLLVAWSVLRNLALLKSVFVDRSLFPEIKSVEKQFLNSILKKVSWEPRRGEPFDYSIVRGLAISNLASMGEESALKLGLQFFENILENREVDPDLRYSAFCAAAYKLMYEDLLKIYEETDSETERIMVLQALTKMPNVDKLEEYLDYVLEKVPVRIKFIPLTLISLNKVYVRRSWDWFKANLDTLSKLPSIHLERVVNSIVPFACIGREEEAEELLKTNDVLKKLSIIPATLERLRVYSRLYHTN